MKKRVLQKWLVSTLLIVCVICATLCLFVPHLKSQPSIGPEIHYYYNDSADLLVETANYSEFVSEIEPDETVNSVYVLDYEPYDMSYDQFTDLNASKAEVDNIRKDFIQKAKVYYSSKNQEFLSSMGVDKNSQDYQVVVSNYSPYVQISYEDKSLFQKYEDNFIDAVKSNSDISEIHVTVPIELEQQDAATVDVATPYDMNDVLSDIGADDQTYTGLGWNVGIMEYGGVAYASIDPELVDLDIRIAGSSTDSSHAHIVTRLLCGSEGVARGVGTVYIYGFNSQSSFISGLNWLIDNYCFVVNASFGVDVGGKYTWVSAFMDYQVRYNRIIFVNSAGNEGNNPNHYVTPPGTGYNVITVANSAKNAYIKNTSSYDVESNLNMNKPNLAAPGSNLVIGENNGINIGYGTSWSAPIVTGVILKLLEEKPGLQLFPEAVSAILMASATNANGQKDEWDTRAGAGIINYKRAREILNNGTYGVFINKNDVNGSVVVSSGEFSAQKGDKIRAVAIWSANSKTSAWGSDVQSNIHTHYSLSLNFVASNEVSLKYVNKKNNMQFFVNEFKLLSNATLRIDLKQSDDKISSDDDFGAIAWYCE